MTITANKLINIAENIVGWCLLIIVLPFALLIRILCNGTEHTGLLLTKIGLWSKEN
jgi:hypothetical protein